MTGNIPKHCRPAKGLSFSHSELKCARAHVWHVYFRRNFRLGPRSYLNELSKLPSQQLGSPGYYERCHFERNDLTCYSQYFQTFCHVKQTSHLIWGGWGCEVSCGGHHRLRGKTTTGSALDGVVFDITQILAYLVHNMSRSQFYLGFGHFGWLPSFFGQ